MTKYSDLLGTREVCALLELRPREVVRLVHRGKLDPALQMPGRTGAFMFDRSEVERYRGSLTTAAAK